MGGFGRNIMGHKLQERFEVNAKANIEEIVVKLLLDRNLIISMAESCTGGMIASHIVNVSGASKVFKQSFVTYCDEAKHTILGVSWEILNEHTAVSSECAMMMAKGCKACSGSDIAISVTGYAGPGDSDEEPKGLVYIGCAYGDNVEVREYRFDGERIDIRKKAADSALYFVKEIIEDKF